jgi:hypothetical protein
LECSYFALFNTLISILLQFWKELKEGQQNKSPELLDLLLQQQQQPEQRPHSRVGHYDGQVRRPHIRDSNTSRQSESSTSDKSEMLMLREKEKGNVFSSMLMVDKINEEPSDLCTGIGQCPKDNKLSDESEVEIRSNSRKISQDRPRLDKSQSTPTYESVTGDTSSFEEKLRDIRLRKQSRVEEETPNLIPEGSNQSSSPTPISRKF